MPILSPSRIQIWNLWSAVIDALSIYCSARENSGSSRFAKCVKHQQADYLLSTTSLVSPVIAAKQSPKLNCRKTLQWSQSCKEHAMDFVYDQR